MNAFVTGSYAYGIPKDTSDIDDEQFKIWREGTNALKKKKPVTKKEVCEMFASLFTCKTRGTWRKK